MPGKPSAKLLLLYKRMYCLIYQTVSKPEGLIFSAYGPVEGRRHNLTLIRMSGFKDALTSRMNVNGRQFHIYGDLAYIVGPYLQRYFHEPGTTKAQRTFNSVISALRVAVEWNYKDHKQQWSRDDYGAV